MKYNKDWYDEGVCDGAVKGAIITTVVLSVVAVFFWWKKK